MLRQIQFGDMNAILVILVLVFLSLAPRLKFEYVERALSLCDFPEFFKTRVVADCLAISKVRLSHNMINFIG